MADCTAHVGFWGKADIAFLRRKCLLFPRKDFVGCVALDPTPPNVLETLGYPIFASRRPRSGCG